MDCVIMNDLMYKLKGYQLPCMNANWVPYSDAAWNNVMVLRNFTHAIMLNIWKVMNKFTNDNSWLTGRAHAMHRFTNKSKDGINFTRLQKNRPPLSLTVVSFPNRSC